MPEVPDRIRAFVALRLSAASEDAIVAFINELRALSGNISWNRRDNLHLTLRFLGGAVPSATIVALAPALERIAASFEPFDLHAHGAGAFPDLRWPRVVWIGTTAAPLFDLVRKIEAAVQAYGLPAESRAYSPHLTIGRVRDLRGFAPLRRRLETRTDRDFGLSRIEAVSLYRSHLGRGGATYEELERFSLAGFLKTGSDSPTSN